MKQKAAVQASQSEGEGVRVVAPVRVFERHSMPFDARPAQELIEAERRPRHHDITALPKSDECFDESVDIAISLQQTPVEPADIGVLAVSVIVASLGSAHLIAHEKHRRAGGQKLQCEEVLDLTIAQRLDFRIVGRPLRTAVPAQIIIGAIAVALAVGLVVLPVVGDQIVEREAIMAGHEIDALFGLALLVTVKVRATQDPCSQTSH